MWGLYGQGQRRQYAAAGLVLVANRKRLVLEIVRSLIGPGLMILIELDTR